MPRTTFDSANKANVGNQYPKLKLDRGERARICVIETDPMVEYVHTLRAPQVVNGRVVMEQIQTRDGTVIEKPKEDFMGQHICLGSFETLESNGSDPANCPTCAAARDNGDLIQTPYPKYAVHVVRYATQPGSFNVQDPFNVTLVGWSFGPAKFNSLIDLRNEWGDLKQRDLLLGPCESKQFQKFEVNVGASCEWLADDTRKQAVARLYKDNKGDLTGLIGRKLARHMIEEDLAKTLARARMAYGNPGAGPDVRSNETAASVDIEGMLGGDDAPSNGNGTTAEATASAPQESGTTADDLASTPTPESSEEDRPSEGELDFDDLLNGLG